MATPMLLYGRKHSAGLNWITAIAMTGFHIGAVAALFYIDLGAMLAAFILYYAGGMLGIGMGYHRLLTHRGYKTPKWVEYFLTFCGTCCAEVLRAAGRWEEGEDWLTRTLSQLEKSGQKARCVHPATRLASFRISQGRLEEAESSDAPERSPYWRDELAVTEGDGSASTAAIAS